MNFSVEHIGIPATDPVALKNWYVRVLGARPVWDNGQTPPSFLIAPAGGAMLEIYPANAVANPGRGDNQLAGFRHVALRVDSIDAAKAELTRRGVTFTEEIRPAGGRGKSFVLQGWRGQFAAFGRAAGELAAGQSVMKRRAAKSGSGSDYCGGWCRPLRLRCLTNAERVFLADMVFHAFRVQMGDGFRNPERLEDLDHNLVTPA